MLLPKVIFAKVLQNTCVMRI